jgi:hypothetical protein
VNLFAGVAQGAERANGPALLRLSVNGAGVATVSRGRGWSNRLRRVAIKKANFALALRPLSYNLWLTAGLQIDSGSKTQRYLFVEPVLFHSLNQY